MAISPPEFFSGLINQFLASVKKPKLFKHPSFKEHQECAKAFIDFLWDDIGGDLSEFEKERMLIASKEILFEILRDKYQIPPFYASMLLLRVGIDSLAAMDIQE